MRRLGTQQGRHRLGSPGLVHCLRYPAVRLVLAGYRRHLWAAFIPPRHSLAGLRRRGAAAAAARAWAPAVVATGNAHTVTRAAA
jgi:hypothetical protein